jgi:sulfonate transport system substrate-binding protein
MKKTLLALGTLAAVLTANPVWAKETIKVGYFSQLHDAALLDLENKLGDKYAFEYVKFQRYADAAIALSRGDIDVSSLGYANLITEAAKNTEPKFVFVSGLARGAINLVCHNDVKVDEWKDLTGKKIGVVAGFPEIFLNDALTTHGQKVNDVVKVNFAVAGPPVLQSLRDKTTDCAAVFEPFGATAVSGGYAYYPKTNIGDNSFKGMNNGIAVNVAFASKNKQAIDDIKVSAKNSTNTFSADTKKWINLMITSQGFEPKIVEIGVNRVALDSALYFKEANVLAGNMKTLGLIKNAPTEEHLKKFFQQ